MCRAHVAMHARSPDLAGATGVQSDGKSSKDSAAIVADGMVFATGSRRHRGFGMMGVTGQPPQRRLVRENRLARGVVWMGMDT